MIRNTRYLAIGSHIDADTRYLSQKLETMAKEGWKLTNVNALLTFKRCEPENLKFEIDYLDTNMALTSNENPTVINYIQLCEESGWSYRGNHGPLFIFSAPKDKEVTPLQTDKELMHQIITSSIIKNNLYFLVFPNFYSCSWERVNVLLFTESWPKVKLFEKYFEFSLTLDLTKTSERREYPKADSIDFLLHHFLECLLKFRFLHSTLI